MRSNAHFGGLLKPVPQEAFSAWLARGARTKNPAPFIRATRCLKRLGVEDADGNLTPAVAEDLSMALGLSSECLRRSFPLPGDWLKAAPEKRLQFCELCLLNDFRSGRQPSSRITWFYWWFNVCPVHGCLLHTGDSTSAPAALLSFVQFNLTLERLPAPVTFRSIERRVKFRCSTPQILQLMAWYFQRWYQASVQRGTVIIGDVELAASVPEVELFMEDILAIIGKKRNYPIDPRSYIARLLDIKSWCSLRSNLRPEAGCEAFLCKDVGEHSAEIRMAMFALLGLFLKLPNCVRVWQLGGGPAYDGYIERLWGSMHSDAVRVPSYLDWLKQRSGGWSPVVRAHFHYLLES
ncbi:TniQ family protein [Pseudomonas sp. FEN]|uniref:TniQ family protein n=1 Tax=Pseudomonas sp. FEN TaxID=2767468 RepID=UPI001CD35817|nr:TniQ family protein [Pseudomonas sp. FEN]